MELEPIALLITAFVGAVSALIGAFIAIHKLPTERRKVQANTAATWTDAQAVIIGNLRDENEELRARLDTYEAAIESLQMQEREMQRQIRDLEQQNKWLVRENTVLRNALTEAGIDVPEFKVQK